MSDGWLHTLFYALAAIVIVALITMVILISTGTIRGPGASCKDSSNCRAGLICNHLDPMAIERDNEKGRCMVVTGYPKNGEKKYCASHAIDADGMCEEGSDNLGECDIAEGDLIFGVCILQTLEVDP